MHDERPADSVKLTIRPARFPEDAETVRALFQDYLDWIERTLGESLSYQNTDAELSTLPGKYAEPAGRIWIALAGATGHAGCVAVRPLPATSINGLAQPNACELKRLWVSESARGLGLGARLLDEALTWAASAAYEQIKLDSDPKLEAAMTLYKRAGFEPTDRYNDDPMPCTLYMARKLNT